MNTKGNVWKHIKLIKTIHRWPPTTARAFTISAEMFVGYINRSLILLHKTVQRREFYGAEMYQFTVSQWKTISRISRVPISQSRKTLA